MTEQPHPAAPPATRRRYGRRGEGRQVTTQLSVRVPADVLAEVQAAIAATAPTGGPTDKTDFVTTAVQALLRTLREDHNHGRPFT